MFVNIYIINNILHTSPINIDIDRNSSFNDIKNKYFENITLPSLYEREKFYFFVNEKKINFNEKISNYISENYKILGLICIYDDNFSDTSNVIILAKDYSILNKDFYMYVSHDEPIIKLKQKVQNYLNRNDITRNIDDIKIIFNGKLAQSDSLLKDYINYSKYSLCTIRY